MSRMALTKEYKPADEMSEDELQSSCNNAFRQAGAEYVYHTTFSIFSEASFPDGFIIYHGRVIVIEFKTEKGKFRPTRLTKKGHLLLGQLDVLGIFIDTGKIEVYTIRPSEYYAGKIERILDGTEPVADIKALRAFEGNSNLSKQILEGLRTKC